MRFVRSVYTFRARSKQHQASTLVFLSENALGSRQLALLSLALEYVPPPPPTVRHHHHQAPRPLGTGRRHQAPPQPLPQSPRRLSQPTQTPDSLSTLLLGVPKAKGSDTLAFASAKGSHTRSAAPAAKGGAAPKKAAKLTPKELSSLTFPGVPDSPCAPKKWKHFTKQGAGAATRFARIWG